MEPSEFVARLERLVDNEALGRVQHAMGMAAKDHVLDAARRTLGADLKFSGMAARKPRAKLGAGYDIETDETVTLKLRPAGLWFLANDGRHGTKPIRPRKGHTALLTPHGYRALSTSTPSRGLGTLDMALDGLEAVTVKAATAALASNIAKAGLSS